MIPICASCADAEEPRSDGRQRMSGRQLCRHRPKRITRTRSAKSPCVTALHGQRNGGGHAAGLYFPRRFHIDPRPGPGAVITHGQATPRGGNGHDHWLPRVGVLRWRLGEQATGAHAVNASRLGGGPSSTAATCWAPPGRMRRRRRLGGLRLHSGHDPTVRLRVRACDVFINRRRSAFRATDGAESPWREIVTARTMLDKRGGRDPMLSLGNAHRVVPTCRHTPTGGLVTGAIDAACMVRTGIPGVWQTRRWPTKRAVPTRRELCSHPHPRRADVDPRFRRAQQG